MLPIYIMFVCETVSLFYTPIFCIFQVESIHGHSSLFLGEEQTQGSPASHRLSRTNPKGEEGDGGGGGGGGAGGKEGTRRASVTSVGSETSICSMSQLGDIISNSEWRETHSN